MNLARNYNKTDRWLIMCVSKSIYKVNILHLIVLHCAVTQHAVKMCSHYLFITFSQSVYTQKNIFILHTIPFFYKTVI